MPWKSGRRIDNNCYMNSPKNTADEHLLLCGQNNDTVKLAIVQGTRWDSARFFYMLM